MNIKVASRAGSVMTVQSSNVENLPGGDFRNLYMIKAEVLIILLTATGGHRHFTATYGTAYDDEEKV